MVAAARGNAAVVVDWSRTHFTRFDLPQRAGRRLGSPMNLAMPALKESLERAGFVDVRTLLSSGDVVFTATEHEAQTLAAAVEALASELGKSS